MVALQSLILQKIYNLKRDYIMVANTSKT